MVPARRSMSAGCEQAALAAGHQRLHPGLVAHGSDRRRRPLKMSLARSAGLGGLFLARGYCNQLASPSLGGERSPTVSRQPQS